MTRTVSRVAQEWIRWLLMNPSSPKWLNPMKLPNHRWWERHLLHGLRDVIHPLHLPPMNSSTPRLQQLQPQLPLQLLPQHLSRREEPLSLLDPRSDQITTNDRRIQTRFRYLSLRVLECVQHQARNLIKSGLNRKKWIGCANKKVNMF